MTNPNNQNAIQEAEQLKFRFVFPDGTTMTIAAPDEYAAARIAREMYYGS